MNKEFLQSYLAEFRYKLIEDASVWEYLKGCYMQLSVAYANKRTSTCFFGRTKKIDEKISTESLFK